MTGAEGMRRKERQSVKLLCTSLTSWTESAQLLKRSERWGKHADTDVHARTRSISPCLGTQHDRIIIIADTHTPICTCAALCFLEFLSFFFLQLCVSIHVSGYVCLKTVSQRISRDLLVILLNTHPPPTPLLTPPLPNLASAPSQRSTSVASMSSHQYEQIIRALRGLSINPHCEYSSHPLPFLSSLPFLSVFLPPPHLPLSCPFHPCF